MKSMVLKSSFLYIEKDDGIHLYVGITKDKEIASRIKDYYEKKDTCINHGYGFGSVSR